MKKTMIAAASIAALAAPAYAELEGDLSLTYQDQYTYRGLADAFDAPGFESDDAVMAALDFSYGLNDNWSLVGNATINTLGNSAVDHEIFRGGVQWKNECYSVEVGYQHQEFSSDRPLGSRFHTNEAYVRLGTKCPITGADVSLLWAKDLHELNGDYVELTFSKSVELCDKVSLDVVTGVAGQNDYWSKTSGLSHAFITVAAPIQLTDNLTLSPYVSFIQTLHALDNDASNVGNFGGMIQENDEFTFGVKASVKF